MNNDPQVNGTPGSDLWERLARYITGESTTEERAAVAAWLAADPARAELLAQLGHSVDRLAARTPPNLDVEAALRRVRARMDEAPVTPLASRRPRGELWTMRWRTTVLRAAAVVVLLLGGVLVWRAMRGGKGTEVSPALSWVTGIGESDSVRLADGSRVLLGPASTLTVAAGYGVEARDVELQGEALFMVQHDAARPFTVHAGAATIHDLGTTFAVHSDAGEEVRVVVTEGSVRLRHASAAESSGVVLHAGDRGVLNPDGRAVTHAPADRETELAWTRGQLIFDDAPLVRVAADLRRWYGIELVVDSSLAGRHLKASFSGEPVDDVLDVIALALGARIERHGDTAFVSRNRGSNRP
jgi:transmembrane sensor